MMKMRRILLQKRKEEPPSLAALAARVDVLEKLVLEQRAELNKYKRSIEAAYYLVCMVAQLFSSIRARLAAVSSMFSPPSEVAAPSQPFDEAMNTVVTTSLLELMSYYEASCGHLKTVISDEFCEVRTTNMNDFCEAGADFKQQTDSIDNWAAEWVLDPSASSGQASALEIWRLFVDEDAIYAGQRGQSFRQPIRYSWVSLFQRGLARMSAAYVYRGDRDSSGPAVEDVFRDDVSNGGVL
jgi:hypothetical protein